MTKIGSKYSRRTIALFWCAVIAVVIGTMIAMEQIAMLYVVATLALVILLFVVGFSDLEKVGRDSVEGLGTHEE